MPTPYGSRGGMAFGAEELRVLRRALALALHPSPASAQDVQDCHRLAESLDEATREGVRLRAFLVADLARYRAALPGTAAGYLALLEEVLGAGHRPDPDDLAALRALRGNPVAAALLQRCQILAEQDVRSRLARRSRPAAASPAVPSPVVPASRTRLLALPGGRTEPPSPRRSPEPALRGARPDRAAGPTGVQDGQDPAGRQAGAAGGRSEAMPVGRAESRAGACSAGLVDERTGTRPTGRPVAADRTGPTGGRPPAPATGLTGGRTAFTAGPAGLMGPAGLAGAPGAGQEPGGTPVRKPGRTPEERPAGEPAVPPSAPAGPGPRRPVPTPGEVFPKRKPQGPADPRQRLAAG
ncbi:hypothetical protein [Streptomyces sp. NPDC093094]|uniref:hypothetical protein n=1 Tax=Streptomyces sp. NPDC093094 TaxID=3366026 RepID=UPI00382B15EC